jgi:hypothetical protein
MQAAAVAVREETGQGEESNSGGDLSIGRRLSEQGGVTRLGGPLARGRLWRAAGGEGRGALVLEAWSARGGSSAWRPIEGRRKGRKRRGKENGEKKTKRGKEKKGNRKKRK